MFSKKLKAIRNRNDITQAELAYGLGVAKGTVAMWEMGKRTPSLKMKVKLADFFGVPMDYFGFDTKEDESLARYSVQSNPEVMLIGVAMAFLRKADVRRDLKTLIEMIEKEEEEHGN